MTTSPASPFSWESAYRLTVPGGGTVVGRTGDFDRRAHWAPLPNLALPAEEGKPLPFITRRMIRTLLRDGTYLAARTLRPLPLRVPEAFVDVDDDLPLRNLTYTEAQFFAEALGGRLPTEKEADLIFAALGSDLTAIAGEMTVWTSSPWDHFAYSAAWFDPSRGLWVGRHAVRNPATGDFRSVIVATPATGAICRCPARISDGQHGAIVVRPL